MDTVPVQPDSPTEIQKYLAYLESDKCALSGRCGGSSIAFIPRRSLLSYFGQQTRCIEQLLREAFQEDAHTISEAQVILDHFLVVFTILLRIGKALALPRFVERDYTDERLPFFDRPRHFPKLDSPFFEAFFDAQWTFCPVKLPKNPENYELEPEQILPLAEKHKIAENTGLCIYRAKIHQEYDPFAGQKDCDVDRTISRTYVFREFAKASRNGYEKELKALISLRRSSHLLAGIVNKFYGSFVQDGFSTIIMAHSDHGSLNEYMLSISPPRDEACIAQLWNGLLNIHEALYAIHSTNTSSLVENKPNCVLQCWYRSLHPANIGVFQRPSGTELCRDFRLIRLGIVNEAENNEAYSAPECSHPTFSEYSDLQAADVWSLGCIISEFAVWMTLGVPGLQRYRLSRREACKITDGHGIAPFHNRRSLLACVSAWHNWAIASKSEEDRFTVSVLQNVVDDMLCDDEGTRLNTRQLKMKVIKLLSRNRTPSIVERSESTSSSNTAFSSPEVPSESCESEQPLLQHARREHPSTNYDSGPLVAPTAPKPWKAAPTQATEFQPALDSRPFSFELSAHASKTVKRTSQGGLRFVGSNRDSAAAPEVVTAQLQSTISSLEHSLTSPSLVNGDDKEIVIPTQLEIRPVLANQSNGVMSSSSLTLRVYTPSLSFQDGLTWMANKKGKACNDVLRDDSYLDDLIGRDFVFLIDNSASMRPHRDRVARAVRLLSWLLKKYDKNGFEIHFTRKFRSEYSRPGHSSDLQKPLQKGLEQGEGRTDVTSSLMRILREFRDRGLPGVSTARAITSTIDRGIKHASAANKIMIYVITDGDWASGSEVRMSERLRDMAKPLKIQGIPENGVGIQFLRLKENEDMTAKLNLLKSCNFADRIKVDCQPLEGDVFRSLLGPISDVWDHENADS